MGEINRVSFCFLFTHVISPIIPVRRPFGLRRDWLEEREATERLMNERLMLICL